MRFLAPEYNSYVAPAFLVGIAGLYLFGCWVGKVTWHHRSVVNLGPFPILYNLFQVILSVYMTWGIFGPRGLYNKFFGLNDEYTEHLEYFVWIHYWSKLLDFLDTFLIILKKNDRQFTLLHIYHHDSIVVIWDLLLNFGVGNGTTAFGAGINSLIHAIMYSHYLVTCLGFENPFKKYLTSAQLIQFLICVLHSLIAGFFERSPARPWWVLQFVYQLTMLYLFMDFYKRTYAKQKEDSEKTKE